MKKLIHAAAVTLFAASAAHGQQAVQWRVEDGGNGHWYQAMPAPLWTWTQSRHACLSRGGDLVTLQSQAESTWVFATLANDASLWWGGSQPRHGPWIGLKQNLDATDYREPDGGWRWVDGSSVVFAAWASSSTPCESQPGDCRCNPSEGCGMNFASYYAAAPCPAGGCTAVPTWAAAFDDMGQYAASYIVEWDADCNADGIVDYGQCRDGTLPDYNSNNVPDCCESGTPCVTSSYPLQWREVDAGNGHWYEVIVTRASFSNHQSAALARGGMVVCVVGADENSFVFRIARAHALPSVWIGLVQDAAGSEPDGGWRWVDGSTSSWRFWGVGEPNNWQAEEDNCVMIVTPAPYDEPYWPSRWQDYADFAQISSIVEWSADCNNDGIVDYGQILQSQLPDANSNGIPDRCECASNPALPACCLGNLNGDSVVDGADLGILLFAWGPAAGAPAADLNADGQVNGADLGVLLSTWGACP